MGRAALLLLHHVRVVVQEGRRDAAARRRLPTPEGVVDKARDGGDRGQPVGRMPPELVVLP